MAENTAQKHDFTVGTVSGSIVRLSLPLILILPRLWNLGITGVLAAEPVTNVVGGLACYFTMMSVVWKKL